MGGVASPAYSYHKQNYGSWGVTSVPANGRGAAYYFHKSVITVVDVAGAPGRPIGSAGAMRRFYTPPLPRFSASILIGY
ncbi:hypothetical protein GWI33_020311 [Rhynchophorus ferrugineus]|uniref:Uncharacterized protein n=1 Tax=Rhynchophorus ferrugineus TaxID=354439 RepID=A0A834M0J3_RHYFE|nr:hypothetical protein GWI33_020311 [Rhynchophorus ferrugineus]